MREDKAEFRGKQSVPIANRGKLATRDAVTDANELAGCHACTGDARAYTDVDT